MPIPSYQNASRFAAATLCKSIRPYALIRGRPHSPGGPCLLGAGRCSDAKSPDGKLTTAVSVALAGSNRRIRRLPIPLPPPPARPAP